jgi:hypothetical protein
MYLVGVAAGMRPAVGDPSALLTSRSTVGTFRKLWSCGNERQQSRHRHCQSKLSSFLCSPNLYRFQECRKSRGPRALGTRLPVGSVVLEKGAPQGCLCQGFSDQVLDHLLEREPHISASNRQLAASIAAILVQAGGMLHMRAADLVACADGFSI